MANKIKTMEDYTPEIKAKIPEYNSRAVDDLYSGKEYKEWKFENTEKYIHYMYRLVDKKKPVVMVANTPAEYRKLYHQVFSSEKYDDLINFQFKLLNNPKLAAKKESIAKVEELKKQAELYDDSAINYDEAVKSHYLYLCSEYTRVYLMWYKFIKDEFKLETEKASELDWLYENINAANIAKGFFNEEIVLILRMPERIMKVGEFIHDAGPDGAIRYSDYKSYYLHGRKVADWIFEKYFDKTLTLRDFSNCDNEEDKGAIVTLIKENEGNEGLLKFLDAELIDEAVIQHRGVEETQRLYKSKERYTFAKDSKGNENVKLAWQEMSCFSTGQNYLIEVCPTVATALEGAKFLRPSQVPMDVPYVWQSAS